MVLPFKVAVVGQGYVGLPLAIAAAEAGISVIGIDIDKQKIDSIHAGKSPVEDISDARLANVLDKASYRASDKFEEIESAQVVVICVPTPLNKDLKPDLSALVVATKNVIPHLQAGALLISESTSFPGTLRDVIYPLAESMLSKEIENILFASSPERVNPGDKNWDITNTPRLVGGLTPQATKKAVEFYSHFCAAVIETETPEIAEAAKILENTFRLVNIALMHEFNQLLSAKQIDFNKVVDAASTKPYGFMPFRSGVGIGGHCIPVDPLYLIWWAREQGGHAKLVEAADDISRNMPLYVAQRALALMNDTTGFRRVLVLGVAYKPGLSDTRETPVLALIKKLQELGADVKWHDPMVDNWNGGSSVGIDWDCEIAILATNQPGLDIDKVLQKGIPILDCTNTYGHKIGVTTL